MRPRASRCRPRSLIDYKSYIDTKLLVARFLEQSSCSMTPDIHELVENIKSVLKSDEEHMEEAITSASFLEQVVLSLIPGMSLITVSIAAEMVSPISCLSRGSSWSWFQGNWGYEVRGGGERKLQTDFLPGVVTFPQCSWPKRESRFLGWGSIA
jgi:hypothetical protein